MTCVPRTTNNASAVLLCNKVLDLEARSGAVEFCFNMRARTARSVIILVITVIVVAIIIIVIIFINIVMSSSTSS